MAITRRGGVRLEVENYEAFTRQLSAASASMRGFGQAAQQTASQVNAAAGEYRGSSVVIEQWYETVDTSADAAAAAAQDYTILGLQLAAIGAAGMGAVVGLGLFASRVEEVGALLEVTRKNAVNLATAEGDVTKAAELNASAVQEQVQGIRDLHLSGLVATETVASLIRYNLDWTKATELARLAQDAATFAMQDSSQAVEGLIHGITTLQPRVLRSYGIMVNLNEAYRDYAAQNNLVATELTQAQRQQAAFNAVLAQAPAIAGAYEASMNTAAKQLRSLNTDIQDFSEEFGEEFVPVLNIGVGALRDVLHWLTELPDPLQAFLVGTTSVGSALALLGGTALVVGPRILGMVKALQAFSAWAGISSAALLGGAGLITGLIGLGVALTALEKAHEQEAAQILDVSESYDTYTRNLKTAGLESYIMTESLWEMAKAAQATGDAFDALEFQQARDEIVELTKDYANFARSMPTFTAEAQTVDDVMGQITDEIMRQLPELSDLQIEMLQDRDALIALAEEIGITANLWYVFADAVQAAASAEEEWRRARVPIGDHEERMLGLVKATVQYEDALREQLNWEEILAQREKARFEANVRQYEQRKEFVEEENKAFESASNKIVDAAIKKERALEDLDTKYHNKAVDAWIEFQRDIADSEADLAAYHAGTLQELLDLDREYLRDRNDAWAEYQQDLADAERELQRDIEDANRERAQALQDLDREYAQDLEDARRDLNQDLEDMAREHAQNLQDIEEERIQDQLDLEQEYQRRLYDIQNAGQQRLLELQLEYEEKASDTRLRYLREALEAIEGGFYAPDFEQTLRELFLGLREFGPGEIPNEFRDAYEQMLEDLEQLRDDQYWEEQDLSDDIDREYDQRMADLEQWLADEQAAIEAAYEERMAAEQERYAREQEERQRDYDRKLEDLRIARERERQEIERDHQQRLADLRLQHERERQEIALNYQRRLEDLQIEYERERQLIGEKLEEQNETARQKYQEALEDISRAKEREREEINKQYARTKEDILADYEDTVTKSAEKFGELPEKFQPVYDRLETQARDEMAAVRQAIMNEINALFADLQARSPSRVMMKLADSIMSGLEAGGLNPDAASDLIGKAFSAQAFQANIQAALPASMAAMPIQGGTSNVTNASTSNLTVNAQYRHQSEASLRNDLALYNSMMRAWGR